MISVGCQSKGSQELKNSHCKGKNLQNKGGRSHYISFPFSILCLNQTDLLGMIWTICGNIKNSKTPGGRVQINPCGYFLISQPVGAFIPQVDRFLFSQSMPESVSCSREVLTGCLCLTGKSNEGQGRGTWQGFITSTGNYFTGSELQCLGD